MPELPDIELYLARLRERVVGERLQVLRIHSPFVLRSVAVSASALSNRHCVGVSRLGKRIVLEFEGPFWAVIHLMIAGRLQWQSPLPAEKRAQGKMMLASFRFESGQLSLVEFSTKKRASIHLLGDAVQLDEHRRAGLDVFACSLEQFRERLRSQNRTLKRALTDPHSFDGIGNAYSDEILFEAGLSPVKRTQSLDEDEVERLLSACRRTLSVWSDRLLELYPAFPKPSDVTAFRAEFPTHGKFGQPCPKCGAPIQRIAYAENETNYCARCQNGGRVLADRSLSRLLKDDWPRTLDDD